MIQKGVKISGYYFRARNCILPETKKRRRVERREEKKEKLTGGKIVECLTLKLVCSDEGKIVSLFINRNISN